MAQKRSRKSRALTGTHSYGSVNFSIMQHDHYLSSNRTDDPDMTTYSMVVRVGNEMLEMTMKAPADPEDVKERVANAILGVMRTVGTSPMKWNPRNRD